MVMDYGRYRNGRRFRIRNAGSRQLPVKRGLVTSPEQWRWSSYRHYALHEQDVVEIESEEAFVEPKWETVIKPRNAIGTILPPVSEIS